MEFIVGLHKPLHNLSWSSWKTGVGLLFSGTGGSHDDSAVLSCPAAGEQVCVDPGPFPHGVISLEDTGTSQTSIPAEASHGPIASCLHDSSHLTLSYPQTYPAVLLTPIIVFRSPLQLEKGCSRTSEVASQPNICPLPEHTFVLNLNNFFSSQHNKKNKLKKQTLSTSASEVEQLHLFSFPFSQQVIHSHYQTFPLSVPIWTHLVKQVWVTRIAVSSFEECDYITLLNNINISFLPWEENSHILMHPEGSHLSFLCLCLISAWFCESVHKVLSSFSCFQLMSFILGAEIPIVTFKGHEFAFYITELQFYCLYCSSQVHLVLPLWYCHPPLYWTLPHKQYSSPLLLRERPWIAESFSLINLWFIYKKMKEL